MPAVMTSSVSWLLFGPDPGGSQVSQRSKGSLIRGRIAAFSFNDSALRVCAACVSLPKRATTRAVSLKYLSQIGGRSGEAAIRALFDQRGPLQRQEQVLEASIEPFVGNVPNLMIDIWRFWGAGSLEEGAFWLAAPGLLDPVVGLIFDHDPDFGGDTYGLAYGAFGNLICWSQRHGPVLVVLQGGSVQGPGFFSPNSRLPQDAELLTLFRDIHPFFFDAVDADNVELLNRSVGRFGKLGPGEVFAAYPIRRVQGDVTIDKVTKMPLLDHLTDVVVNLEFMLRDYQGGNLNIRPIGRGAER